MSPPERKIGSLNAKIHELAAPALVGEGVQLDLAIHPTDRAIPARLCHAVARRKHELRMQQIKDGSLSEEELDLPTNSIRLQLAGSAGQGLGVFLTAGIAIDLIGEANDSVGKSMSGGSIVIRPPAGVRFVPADNAIIGNCALYGATGGRFFGHGRAGDRFAVRNSGATAVIEGGGMHACEYMTMGTVVILGATGANLGAGMTGGVVFLRQDQQSNLNREYVSPQQMNDEQVELLRGLLTEHVEATGSKVAQEFLHAPDGLQGSFLVCLPNKAVATPPAPLRGAAEVL